MMFRYHSVIHGEVFHNVTMVCKNLFPSESLYLHTPGVSGLTSGLDSLLVSVSVSLREHHGHPGPLIFNHGAELS